MLADGCPEQEEAAELRAEIARRQTPIYRLAARVGLHPSHLGQAIGGRRPLGRELATRIWLALLEDDPEANGSRKGDAQHAGEQQ
jgi:hypothetical protein